MDLTLFYKVITKDVLELVNVLWALIIIVPTLTDAYLVMIQYPTVLNAQTQLNVCNAVIINIFLIMRKYIINSKRFRKLIYEIRLKIMFN